MDQAVVTLSALELAQLIREKELTPTEVVEAYLQRIEEIDPALGSYITVAGEQALDAAKRATAEVGGADLPPFHGVPIGVKDSIDTAGITSTSATAAWRDRVPDYDPAVVTKVKQAGFIIIGKHNLPEFTSGTYTEPLAYGPCRNPWNPDFTPGGSSGGSGAATAAGLCPIALGTDGGGSIRIPAGWTGLVGIKPSRGRVSMAPAPNSPWSTPGPMAHTVADAAAMLDAISGYVVGDGFWAPEPERPFSEEVGRDPGRLRIAFTTAAADGVEVHPSYVDAVATTARAFESLGHDVFGVDDWPGRGMFPDNRGLGLHIVYGARFAALVEHGEWPEVEQLEPGMQLLIQWGSEARAADFAYATHLEGVLARTIVAPFFDQWDVLLTPVTSSQPTRIGEIQADPSKAFKLLHNVQFTGQFSQTGQPGISVPCSVDPDGVPIGVQLVGRPADEATLIRLASQLEQVNPWADRRPPLPWPA